MSGQFPHSTYGQPGSLWQDDKGGLCTAPAYGPYGMGSAMSTVPHEWRFQGVDNGKEKWYCSRCRKFESFWARPEVV